MKPLPMAPWTAEDTDIWIRVLERKGLYWYATTLQWFQGQDKRDAALMFGYEDAKARYIASAGVFAYWEARRMGVDLARRAMR